MSKQTTKRHYILMMNNLWPRQLVWLPSTTLRVTFWFGANNIVIKDWIFQNMLIIVLVCILTKSVNPLTHAWLKKSFDFWLSLSPNASPIFPSHCQIIYMLWTWTFRFSNDRDPPQISLKPTKSCPMLLFLF